MKTCHNCACDPVCDHNWNGWETCGNWIQKPEKPPTNADRIRAMSDEELAKWLEYEGGGVCAEVCGWMNWLQQPAEADI
jgi:hypothetical protein